MGFVEFAGMAATIAALDLVISDDTSVAHVAARLGVPTWILLLYRPEWRWHPVETKGRGTRPFDCSGSAKRGTGDAAALFGEG